MRKHCEDLPAFRVIFVCLARPDSLYLPIVKFVRAVLFQLMVALLALWITTMVHLPSDGRFWRVLENTGHFPLFGAITLASWFIFRKMNVDRSRSSLSCYFYAFAFAALLGVLTEIVQGLTGRDAEVGDFLMDCLGAIAFLGFITFFDQKLRPYWTRCSSIIRILAKVSALLLLAPAIIPPTLSGASYFLRNRAFPVVSDAGSWWARQFLEPSNSRLSTAPLPRDSKMSGSKKSLQLTMQQAEYSGLALSEPYPDWTGYHWLRFQIYLESADSLMLVVRIEDDKHNGDYDDRYNARIALAPRDNEVVIAIERIAHGPIRRILDVRHIRRLMIFAHELKCPTTIYLGAFRLE